MKRIPSGRRIVAAGSAGSWIEQVNVGNDRWENVDGVTYTSSFADKDTILMSATSDGIECDVLLVYSATDMLFHEAGGIEGADAEGNFHTHPSELAGCWVVSDISEDDEEVEVESETRNGSFVTVNRYKVFSVSVEVGFLALSLATTLKVSDIPTSILPPGVRDGDIQNIQKRVSRSSDGGAYRAAFTVEARMFIGTKTVQAARSLA